MSLSSRGTVIGTTSACAENTNGIPLTTLTWGNYLRVRGEYVASCCSFRERLELPPRTRRILRRACSSSHVHGTTSACAENTINLLCTMRGTGNYLRVRGEYSVPTGKKILKKELPPRARRILRSRVSRLLARGTTSACAENTENLWPSMVGNRNYLRVRGEYLCDSGSAIFSQELPPRARRIPTRPVFTQTLGGTTSACAENT